MRRRLGIVILLAVIGAAGVAVLAGNNPAGSAFFPQCLFHRLTGFHCAGCGITRALHALLHFRFAEAMRMHPLLVLSLPLVGYAVAIELTAWVLGDRYRGPRVRLPAWGYWILIATILGYWVLRNVPVWPFTLLAPH